jgi:hypothetical protein
MTIQIGNERITGDELLFTAGIRRCVSPLCGGVWIARLRLSSPGQTEYRLTPQQPFDWGDAPFMTTLAQNGARHRIVPGFHLGAGVDFEPDGQASDGADEDGVVFRNGLLLGQSARIEVTASSNGVCPR